MAILLFLWILLPLLNFCAFPTSADPIRLSSSTVYKNSTCFSQRRIAAQRNVVKETLKNMYHPCSCGDPGWTRVAYLNMSDPSHHCPSNWALISTPLRGCGRSSSSGFSCDSAFFRVSGRTYSTVCGRVHAYQKGIAAAFFNFISYRINLEAAYVSGLSLTYGRVGARRHIWTFAGTFYEQDPSYRTDVTCPCTYRDFNQSYQIPPYIGNDYFCDTGNPGPGFNVTALYADDPLWDGKGCGFSTTCCEFNTPPWFCKMLPQSTNEDLELRMCYEYSSHVEDKLVSLIEIYVK